MIAARVSKTLFCSLNVSEISVNFRLSSSRSSFGLVNEFFVPLGSAKTKDLPKMELLGRNMFVEENISYIMRPKKGTFDFQASFFFEKA